MKYATGHRLKTIARELYDGNVSELARKLEMKPQALAKYVKGESMPGGLVLIRLHDIGVNINWFLTGEGDLFLGSLSTGVSEPVGEYLEKIGTEDLNEDEQKIINQLLQFSEMVKSLEISTSLQRALLTVYARHFEGKEKDSEI